MSIHTILSQMEGQVFGHGEEVIEISIYRKDGKILSIPYNQVKTGLETFATRIVEEISEDTKHMEVPIHPDFPKDVPWSIENYALYCRGFHRALKEIRTKLQKMKNL